MTDPMIESFERWHMSSYGHWHLHSSKEKAHKDARAEIWQEAWGAALASQIPPKLSDNTDSGSQVSDIDRIARECCAPEWHDESAKGWHMGLDLRAFADRVRRHSQECPECDAQARLLGMSAEREAALLAKVDRDEKLLRQALDALARCRDVTGDPAVDKFTYQGEAISAICDRLASAQPVVTVTTWLDEAMRLADDLIEIAWSAGVDTEQTPSSHTEELAAIREPVDAARAALLEHLSKRA